MVALQGTSLNWPARSVAHNIAAKRYRIIAGLDSNRLDDCRVLIKIIPYRYSDCGHVYYTYISILYNSVYTCIVCILI